MEPSVSALVLRPALDFVDLLTPEARAIYEQPDGKNVFLQRCRCGALDRGDYLPDPNFKHGRRHCSPPWPSQHDPNFFKLMEGVQEHGGGKIVATATTMNITFSTTVMALAAFGDKAYTESREIALKRLAKAYNKGVEAGLIDHGGLMKVMEMELLTLDLTRRWVLMAMPYVPMPSEDFKPREWLAHLNEKVWPTPDEPNVKEPRRPWMNFFKFEGQI